MLYHLNEFLDRLFVYVNGRDHVVRRYKSRFPRERVIFATSSRFIKNRNAPMPNQLSLLRFTGRSGIVIFTSRNIYFQTTPFSIVGLILIALGIFMLIQVIGDPRFFNILLGIIWLSILYSRIPYRWSSSLEEIDTYSSSVYHAPRELFFGWKNTAILLSTSQVVPDQVVELLRAGDESDSTS